MSFMRKKTTHFILAFLMAVISFLVLNSVINLIWVTVLSFLSADSFLSAPDIDYSVKEIVLSFSNIPFVVYMVLIMISLAVGGVVLYKLRNNFQELEQTGIKGTSRFTTLAEIQEQYKSVPEKEKKFDGNGGVPVSRYKQNIYIDESPVNNLWIGTTRSGKGEMGMFPMIDIYSRAKKPASMVLNDPKGELFAASRDTLEQRGYHVEVLNLDDPLQSMSYQLLQLVIDAYEEGNMSKAEQYTKTISHMLYSDPAAKDKFWQDSASALCTALILGLCEKNIPGSKEKITMYTVANTLNVLASEKYTNESSGEQYTGLDNFFDSLPEHHPAKLQYATVKFASGAGQTVAGIFANAFDKLSIFTLTPIAKMTSKNSFEMRKIGFGKVISGHTAPLSRIDIRFNKGSVSVKSDDTGLFTINHDKDVSKGDKIELTVQKTKIQQTLYVKAIDEKTGEIDYEIIEDKKEEGKGITIKRFEHFNKPTALFMITPDYDTSLHIIASLYVKQLYTELARTASNTEGGKCIREVIFILDEFGNMPVIDDMSSIITVCLSRNIKFNLVVQAYSQLKQKYDKDWETIDGNCANTIYILTTNNDTAEEISKKIGEKTVSSKSRSGSTLSLDKSKTEGTEGRRLLTAEELRQLQEGEMVVIRGIKRQDKKRRKVTPYPIFNTGKTRMKYRYQYLADDFDTDKSINDIDIPSEHAELNLSEVIYKFKEGDLETAESNKKAENQSQQSEQGSSNKTDKEDNKDVDTVGYVFADDKIVRHISDNVLPQTDKEEIDINRLTLDQFINLINDLEQNGFIDSDLHNAVIDKISAALGEEEKSKPRDKAHKENTNEQQDKKEVEEEAKEEKELPIQELFAENNILKVIEDNVIPKTDKAKQDVYNLTSDQFVNLLNDLKAEDAIVDKTYRYVKGIIENPPKQQDSEEAEQGALPM